MWHMYILMGFSLKIWIELQFLDIRGTLKTNCHIIKNKIKKQKLFQEKRIISNLFIKNKIENIFEFLIG